MPVSIPEYEIVKKTQKAVIIHCSDPRFQDAFRKFIEEQKKMKVGEYTPIIIPGGPGNLGRPKTHPIDFESLLKQVEFFLNENKTNTVILINHQDCKYYQEINKGYKHVLLEEKDMKKVYNILKKNLPKKVKIDMYYAYLISAEKICFKKLSKK